MNGKLQQALSRFAGAQFEWGKADCCLFVADVIEDLRGTDFAAPWRGKYKTERGALRLLTRHGGIEGLATAAWGPMRPPLLARRGDPVLFSGQLAPDSIGAALGICDGGIVYLCDGGLARAPMELALGCWNV